MRTARIPRTIAHGKTKPRFRKHSQHLDSSSGIKDKKTPRIARLGSGGQQIDDLLDGCVGAVVGGFELAGRLMMGVGAVMEAAVGERAAETFVEEQKEQRNLNPLGGETVGIAGAVTLQQTVAPCLRRGRLLSLRRS